MEILDKSAQIAIRNALAYFAADLATKKILICLAFGCFDGTIAIIFAELAFKERKRLSADLIDNFTNVTLAVT